MSATEIADAYVALYVRMPGVQKDIERSLGGSEVGRATEKSGRGIGAKLTSAIGGVVKGGLITVGAVAAAGMGAALVKGLGRLGALDEATAKLTGLGHNAVAVDQIMTNALAAVKGTAFGMGEAATTAAGAVAAGIKPGQELEGVLTSVANSAAAAGVGMDEMGSIYNKVASLGKAGNDVLQQVADRGIPIYQTLADQLGVTTEEVFKMASAGQIGFEEFEEAMSSASGTVAEEMGTTLPGASSNFLASLGRIGAGFLGGIYPLIAPLITAITGALGPVEAIAASVGEKFGDFLAPIIESIIDMLEGGFDLSGFLEMAAALSPLGLAFKALQPVIPVVMDAFAQLAPVLGGALMGVLDAILPLISKLSVILGETLAAVLPSLMPLFTTLGTVIEGLVPVFTVLAEYWGDLAEMLMPLLAEVIAALVPIILTLLEALIPLIDPILAMMMPLIDLVKLILPPLIDLFVWLIEYALLPLQLALDAVIPIIVGVVEALSSYLVPIIETVTAVMGGLITFLTGVFSGNWEQAWQGIQDVFSGIWQGIQDIAKGAVNFIIDLINGVIGAINGLAGGLSDATGGAINLSIPTIPCLAEGGILNARPGGHVVRMAEAGHAEAALPLGGPKYVQFTDDIAAKLNSRTPAHDDGPIELGDKTIEKIAHAGVKYQRMHGWSGGDA
ncbi:tape measure protein [Chryseoglobus sp. 28M-23]|uniref:phage tail protein n=1 Tax=Chryseoglobus sp. 28M-23 TaxID=2772253 RepID=UPI0017472791|nr:tape measure protein [Chryseoglobus sp. 28M-23]QOD93479.1 tape measure protein [Chryseoglobus sp. 28M-23]